MRFASNPATGATVQYPLSNVVSLTSRSRMPRLTPLLIVAFLALGAQRVAAQLPLGADPAHAWRTITTAHFRVHHRAEHAAWAQDVAARIEAVRTEVVTLVGYAPPRVIDVVIDDPVNGSNGVALPDLSGLAMLFWPTPPDPSGAIGNHSGWGELLSIHEFAHIAHLSRPARDPWERFVLSLPIVPAVGPVVRRVPAWVMEGYATYVEGVLSGSGRPNGTWRAAVLREWALEGMLPSYGGLNDDGAFLGGSMRYLAGSAFLEWLVAQRGDSALPQLWRRLSARQARSFDQAFAGTFGDSPSALYGQFRVDVTARALEAKRVREREGLAMGERVARLERGVGAPAVSRDGARIAIALAPLGAPPRIEIWRAEPAPPDSAGERARAQAQQRDPDDVADWSPWPRRPEALATLWPVRGRAHEHPRFMPDGRTVLVTRPEPLPGGGWRPDLFLWDPRGGQLRRITRGAGIRYADPTPDGGFAVGVRCTGGACEVVEIRLANGGVRVLAAGSPRITYSGARLSADGERVATAQQSNGRWRPAIIERTSGTIRLVGDSAASRYAPIFVDDDRALVVTSEASGVPDLERIDIATSATRPLTRGLGAALQADAASHSRAVWFLALHARGMDLRKVSLDAAPLASTMPLLGPAPRGSLPPGALAPAVAPAPAAQTRAWLAAPVVSTAYGVGPVGWRLLPVGSVGLGGVSAGLAGYFTDPVGRLAAVVQGAIGAPATWQGAAASVSWRGWRPELEAELWWAGEQPSRGSGAAAGSAALDLQYTGVSLSAALRRSLSAGTHSYRAGLVGATISPLGVPGATYATRVFAFAEFGQAYRQQRRGTWLSQESLVLHASTGSTDGARWTRLRADGWVSTGSSDVQLRFEGTYGRVTSAANASELFTIGGMASPFVPAAALSQRFAVPSLAAGSLAGSEAVRTRISVGGGGYLLAYDVIAAGAQTKHPTDWWRIAGIETHQHLDRISIVRVPAMDLRAGIAYIYDGPDMNCWRGWLTFTVRP